MKNPIIWVWLIGIVLMVNFSLVILYPRKETKPERPPIVYLHNFDSINNVKQFRMDGGTYPSIVDVIITDNDSIAFRAIRQNIDSTIQMSYVQRCDGITFNDGGLYFLVWLRKANMSPEGIGTINHELLHVTHMTMGTIGITLSNASEEAYAYEMGYLSEQFYRHLMYR